MTEQPACMGCCVNQNWMQQNWMPSNIPIYTAANNRQESLSHEEKDILMVLADSWNRFNALNKTSVDDLNEFRDAIHRCQQLIALRVARRADPDVWHQPE